MSKKYRNLLVIIILVILGVLFIGYEISLGETSTTITTQFNYEEFTTEKITPWLDKVTLFFTTFAKQVGELFRKIFTADFIGICLKFLKGMWEFIVGIFKMFFDLLAKTFNK